MTVARKVLIPTFPFFLLTLTSMPSLVPHTEEARFYVSEVSFVVALSSRPVGE